jgi:ATP-binding cassette, subfamily B, multidrug efflux pump
MFSLNATLAFISILFIPIAIGFIYLYQKYSTKHYQTAREKNSQINTRISESISGMKIIQDFNQQKRFVREFSELNNEYYEASLMNLKIDGLLLAPVIHVLTAIALASIIFYSGVLSLNGVVMVGGVFAFIDLIYRLFDPMFQIMDRLSLYQQAVVAGDRIFKIIDNVELTPSQNEGANAKITNAKVEFKNVSFSYDGVNQVLKDISFVVNPGETVALVGHTGSGKSSIINVMMRFYEFFEGDILIDDVSIREYPLEHLRSKMGLVLQDPFIYVGTIADNIRLLNQDISDEAIKAAAEFVQADDFISALDDKYEHKVIEEGAAFSTGQKQLLAFARAIVTDPKILILDEATANVDTETEVLIQEGLKRIREGRTNLMIAHRLSTIRDANQILVLEDGEIVERGNHDELMSQKGLYFAMVELQNSNMELNEY